MKIIIAMLMVLAALAACTPTEQGAALGAATGGVIGGVATGKLGGAAVGAAVGGVAGALIGHASEGHGQCYYRDRYGRRYTARCPSGY
ncbi:MAG TPA: glycine zipper domain-containing protein [Pararhizobium sp.]|nr:glycine zipper domain-containing protein [Pararhizobium sp.]